MHVSGYDFNFIYHNFQRQMLFLAEEILQNRSDAEDAVQNAFFRISKQQSPLPQNERALRVYLLTAAKHAALDLLPKQSKEANLEELTLPSGEDVFTQIAASQDYDRLLAAVSSLPLKYREVLMLRYVQELEVKEIGRLLKRPHSTIQKQLARGKALLVKLYEKEDFQNG